MHNIHNYILVTNFLFLLFSFFFFFFLVGGSGLNSEHAHKAAIEVCGNNKVRKFIIRLLALSIYAALCSHYIYRHSIANWLQSGNTSKPLIIQTNNSFIRRLVHQELQDG